MNKYLLRGYYEIPKLEEITVKFANKNLFRLFDLESEFHKIALNGESSNLCSFSTPFGLYRYLHAPIGLSILPEYFQRLTSKYFGNIKGVVVYFDDIFSTTDSELELNAVVNEVH